MTDSPNQPLQPLDRLPAKKKTYATPRLEVYGDLRAITNTKSTSGSSDNGKGKNSRTA
jgi:hypothetical protein